MNLTDLYTTTPSEEHDNIVVVGDRVYVRTHSGVDQYALLPDGKVELVYTDPKGQLDAIQQDLTTIKATLGI